MSIVSEIERIKTNIANAYTVCGEKGATMPNPRNSENLANCIGTITGGGGGNTTYTVSPANCQNFNATSTGSAVALTWKDTDDFMANYTRLEYIESTGEQFIELNNLLTKTTKAEIDMQITNSDTDSINGVTGDKDRFMIGTVNNTEKGFYFGIGSSNLYLGTKDTNRHTFYIDLANKTYGYDNVSTTTTQTISLTNMKMSLFCRTSYWSGAIGVRQTLGYQKLYGFKMWNSGTLTCDIVPVMRKSDGELGLYDLISNVFYSNMGTGTFIGGGIREYVEWQGTKLVRKENSYPSSLNDGVLVLDNTIANQYAQTEFVDSGVTAGNTYYYQLFPYTSNDGVNTSCENRLPAITV